MRAPSTVRLYQPYCPRPSRKKGKARFTGSMHLGPVDNLECISPGHSRREVNVFSHADHAVYPSWDKADAHVAKVSVVPRPSQPGAVFSIFTNGSAIVRPPFCSG